jgi:hypothetical protein
VSTGEVLPGVGPYPRAARFRAMPAAAAVLAGHRSWLAARMPPPLRIPASVPLSIALDALLTEALRASIFLLAASALDSTRPRLST